MLKTTNCVLIAAEAHFLKRGRLWRTRLDTVMMEHAVASHKEPTLCEVQYLNEDQKHASGHFLPSIIEFSPMSQLEDPLDTQKSII